VKTATVSGWLSVRDYLRDARVGTSSSARLNVRGGDLFLLLRSRRWARRGADDWNILTPACECLLRVISASSI